MYKNKHVIRYICTKGLPLWMHSSSRNALKCFQNHGYTYISVIHWSSFVSIINYYFHFRVLMPISCRGQDDIWHPRNVSYSPQVVYKWQDLPQLIIYQISWSAQHGLQVVPNGRTCHSYTDEGLAFSISLYFTPCVQVCPIFQLTMSFWMVLGFYPVHLPTEFPVV